MNKQLRKLKHTGIIYLAVPYANDYEAVREYRYESVTKVASILMRSGKVVYSPITHNHPIATKHSLPKGWDYWKTFDIAFLSVANEFYVLRLEGWEVSTGVAAETEIARDLGIAVTYLDPEDFGIKRLDY